MAAKSGSRHRRARDVDQRGDTIRGLDIHDELLVTLDADSSNEVIGRGSYGTVYRGLWHGAGVAVKYLHPVLLQDGTQKGLEKFMSEMSKLSALSHPHIIQFIGVTSPKFGDVPGIVMELLNCTLRERYTAHPQLLLIEQLVVALDVASGLSYLHGRQIVHRDITTNNVMLTDGQTLARAKITDVGSSRQLGGGAAVAGMTVGPGNQSYMAPETMHAEEDVRRGGGEGRAVYGFASDVYSYGVVLLAMCVRREPPGMYIIMTQGREADMQDLDDHPLASLIVDCLRHGASSRPRASDLVQLTNDLRRAHGGSLSAASSMTSSMTSSQSSSMDASDAQLKAQIGHLEAEVRRLAAEKERDVLLMLGYTTDCGNDGDDDDVLNFQNEQGARRSTASDATELQTCDNESRENASHQRTSPNKCHSFPNSNVRRTRSLDVSKSRGTQSYTAGVGSGESETSPERRTHHQQQVHELLQNVRKLNDEVRTVKRDKMAAEQMTDSVKAKFASYRNEAERRPALDSARVHEMEAKIQQARTMADRKVQDAVQEANEAKRALSMSRHELFTVQQDVKKLRSELGDAQKTCAAAQDDKDHVIVVQDKLVNTLLSHKFLTSSPESQRSVPATYFLLGASRGRQQLEEVTCLPKWKTCGQLPQRALNRCNQPCVFGGHLYIGIALDTSDELSLLRAPLNDLSETSWEAVVQPRGGKWNYHCYLVSSPVSLWIVVTNLERTEPYSVFRLAAARGGGCGDTWLPVTTFPLRRTAFGVGCRGSTLAVVGGCCGVHDGRDDPVLTPELFDTARPSLPWQRLPCLPRHSKSPTVVDYAGCLHAIGGHGYADDDHRVVLSLDIRASEERRRWTRSVVPPVPFRRCGAAVVNNQLVVAGGQAPDRQSAVNVVMFLDRGSGRWLQLPPLECPQFSPRVLSDGERVWCLGGFERGGEFHRDIEVLQINY